MFTSRLRPFQRPAAKKMMHMGAQLLVFDMGLGKTPTTLAVIEDLFECRDVTSGLWVTLASLKLQIQEHVREHTNSDALVVEGTKSQRRRIYDQARLGKWPYIVLNYEQIRDETEEVRSLPRDFLVYDEVTAIGSTSKRAKEAKKLRAPFQFGLTGTPVENRIEELFSIMEWLEPEVLGRWELFDLTFIVRKNDIVRRVRNLPLLREIMDPWWVRVNHDEVAHLLPEVDPVLIPVHLDPAAARLYHAIAGHLLEALEEAIQLGGIRIQLTPWANPNEDPLMQRAKGKIMARFTALRMLCSHPRLLQISAEKFERTEGKIGSEYIHSLTQAGLLDILPTARPKMIALVDRLKLARDAGHSSVVFTGWVEMINLLLPELEKQRIKALPFHGQLSQRVREDNKQAFKAGEVQVLVSSDAGGYGVDLPEGRILLNYDQPWSAGRLKQRNGRIMRLSSKHKVVNIGDVIVRGSVEEWIAEKVGVKKALGAAVVDGIGIGRDGDVAATGESLKTFLESASP